MPATQAAADSCLSAPKGATPAGSHWYYRIDRVTKRQCWYLREESDTADDKFARAAPPASAAGAVFGRSRTGAAAATNDHTQVDLRRTCRMGLPATPRRAEFARQSRAANGCGSSRTGRSECPARSHAERARAGAAVVDAMERRSRHTRSLANPTDLQVAAANPPAAQPPQAEEVQQPAAADQVAPAAAEAATAKPTASLQKLLLVMAAALALAGLTVSAIVRIGRMRARRAMRRKRRAMWDSAKTAKTRRRSPQPMFHDEDAALRRTGGVHNPRVPQDRTRVPQERTRVPQERTRAPQERTRVPQERPRPPQERRHVPQEVPQDRERELQVTEMLARLARSAQT